MCYTNCFILTKKPTTNKGVDIYKVGPYAFCRTQNDHIGLDRFVSAGSNDRVRSVSDRQLKTLTDSLPPSLFARSLQKQLVKGLQARHLISDSAKNQVRVFVILTLFCRN